MPFIKSNFIDTVRLSKKYQKTKESKGVFFAIFYIFFFGFRDLLNGIILLFIKTSKNNSRNIIFVEPYNQGFGDLFFQTALFSSLKDSGYSISILVNNNHKDVLYDNIDIDKIFFWNFKDILSLIFHTYTLVGLGRSTFRESLLLLFSIKSNKIILDKNIDIWRKIFSNNTNTIAWIKIVSHYLEIELSNKIPKISYLKNINTIRNRIGIIYGVTNKNKIFDDMDTLIDKIPHNYEIILLGKGNKKYCGKRRLIQKMDLSYKDTLKELAQCPIVIGTEGSLVHIASTVCQKVIVLDNENRFIKNAHPDLINKVYILNNQYCINDVLKQI